MSDCDRLICVCEGGVGVVGGNACIPHSIWRTSDAMRSQCEGSARKRVGVNGGMDGRSRY